MESVIEFQCFEVPMEIRVDYLNDNQETRRVSLHKTRIVSIHSNQWWNRTWRNRVSALFQVKDAPRGRLIVNGHVIPRLQRLAFGYYIPPSHQQKSYRAYEEGRLVGGAPISGVSMPTPSTLDVTQTSATPVRAPVQLDRASALVDRAPATVDPTLAPVINV
ncbi:hypothetical protein BpHYR1_017680 [Brachionus plicatilis]|uniref:Uncharacterized protein n=1 Tax=Brachionus plicatilis TaxID=10195 RepID=A0A3M7RT31_BRAPC|nr:hypothetical protein BpHYR1_017680 [Brachionus plicatilis]